MVETGNVRCHRDGTHYVDPTQPWDLDHPDDGSPSVPSCASCNRSATRGVN